MGLPCHKTISRPNDPHPARRHSRGRRVPVTDELVPITDEEQADTDEGQEDRGTNNDIEGESQP